MQQHFESLMHAIAPLHSAASTSPNTTTLTFHHDSPTTAPTTTSTPSPQLTHTPPQPPQQNSNLPPPSSSSQQQQQPPHYRIACQPCRSAHTKCDKILPCCSQCLKSGKTCEYAPPKKRRPRRRTTTTVATAVATNELNDDDNHNNKKKKKMKIDHHTSHNDMSSSSSSSSHSHDSDGDEDGEDGEEDETDDRVPIEPEVPFRTSDLVNFYYRECNAHWNLVPQNLVSEAVLAAENKQTHHNIDHNNNNNQNHSNQKATSSSGSNSNSSSNSSGNSERYQFDLHVNKAVWCSVQMMSLSRILAVERHEEELENRLRNIIRQLNRMCQTLLLRVDLFKAIPYNEKLAWAAMNMSIYERVYHFDNRGGYEQWMGLVKSYLKSAQSPSAQLKACYGTFKWRSECKQADPNDLRGYKMIAKSLKKRIRLNRMLLKSKLWIDNSVKNRLLEDLINVIKQRITRDDQSVDLAAVSTMLDLLQQIINDVPQSATATLDLLSCKIDCILNEESRVVQSTPNETLNHLYAFKREVSDQISLFLASFPKLPIDTLWNVRQVCVAVSVHFQCALRGESVLDILRIDARILELLDISRRLPEKGITLLREVNQWIASVDQSRQSISNMNTQHADQQYLGLNTNVSSFVDLDLNMEDLLLDDATVLQILADLAPANSTQDFNFTNLFD